MELHFTRTNGAADDAIDQLLDLVGGIGHPEIVRQIILAALKAGQENTQPADLKLMNTTLKEMRFTAKTFAPYRKVRKVSVFGSARAELGEPIYEMARLLGRRLAEGGHMVITGGGPGIMQAVNEGAGPEYSFGVNIRLPFEQKSNHIVTGNPRSITYKYFFNRKVAFLKEADAVVLFPGGFGTLDEAMETLTLVQTGKRYPFPVVLIDSPGGTYWSHWLAFVQRELLARHYICATDLHIFDRVDSADDAVRCIDRFYLRYHSLRYVGDRLVLRLTSRLSEEDIGRLKSDFADLLTPKGDLSLSGPAPEEADEPDIANLPRLTLDFNRRSFGRLRMLIDAINQCHDARTVGGH